MVTQLPYVIGYFIIAFIFSVGLLKWNKNSTLEEDYIIFLISILWGITLPAALFIRTSMFLAGRK